MVSLWTVVEPSLPALVHLYRFGPGKAYTLAVPAKDGVVVVSPPLDPSQMLLDELKERGELRAIVAPNAFHHLGLPSWRARFPSVPIFAPAQSIARITSKSKVTGIKPVSELASLLDDRVEILDMPHYKTGEVLVRWKTESGYAWFVTDVVMNMPEEDMKFPFKQLFKWTRSAPGLRRNAISASFMVKDKRSLYAWLNEQAAQKPPSLIVTCHGKPVTLGDPAGEVAAALR